MAAEAPESVIDAMEAQQSVVEAVAAHLALAAPAAGEDAPAAASIERVNGDGRVRKAVAPAGTEPAPPDAESAPMAAGESAAPPAEENTPPAEESGRFAALAVLDVLRASGWADVTEASQLRADAERLRELLDMVVRDHRARQGAESQQSHWLVPLLRAAHGVAFGSLGAKVALRTAVQQVPAEVLASAGLRLDDHEPAEREPAEREPAE